jgi:hypothetical protein
MTAPKPAPKPPIPLILAGDMRQKPAIHAGGFTAKISKRVSNLTLLEMLALGPTDRKIIALLREQRALAGAALSTTIRELDRALDKFASEMRPGVIDRDKMDHLVGLGILEGIQWVS